MSPKILSQLNGAQSAQINGLADECSARDGIKYTPYTGSEAEGDFFALCYKKKRLVGFAFLCAGEPAEISGFVHPDFRRRHIFTSMVKALKRHAKAGAFEFSGRDGYPGFGECSAALGASVRREEYLMRFASETLPVCAKALRFVRQEDGTLLFFENGEAPIGRVALYYDGALANICNVFVEPDFRRQGVGFSMLCFVLSELKGQGVNNIILQVSGSNKPALSLYAKCGFEIADSVVFYSRFV